MIEEARSFLPSSFAAKIFSCGILDPIDGGEVFIAFDLCDFFCYRMLCWVQGFFCGLEIGGVEAGDAAGEVAGVAGGDGGGIAVAATRDGGWFGEGNAAAVHCGIVGLFVRIKIGGRIVISS
jgi:hypothetical protein